MTIATSCAPQMGNAFSSPAVELDTFEAAPRGVVAGELLRDGTPADSEASDCAGDGAREEFRDASDSEMSSTSITREESSKMSSSPPFFC